MAILVTGSTGFIGQYLVRRLAKENHSLILLVRPQSMNHAQKIFSDLNVEYLSGDLGDDDVLSNFDDLEKVANKIEKVIHLAASYDLTASYAEAYLGNVVAMHNFINLCNNFPNLESFHFTSTLAMCGDHKGIFKEKDFNKGQDFPNAYAKTKFRAEAMVGSWKSDVDKVIYRLGIVVGDSHSGYIPKIDGPYFFLKTLKNLQASTYLLNLVGFLPLPISYESIIYLVTVDDVCEALCQSISKAPSPVPSLTTYHLVGPGLSLKDFVKKCFKHFSYKVQILPMPIKLFPEKIAERLGLPHEVLAYMQSKLIMDQSAYRRDFPEHRFKDFEEYENVFFNFADQMISKKDES